MKAKKEKKRFCENCKKFVESNQDLKTLFYSCDCGTYTTPFTVITDVKVIDFCKELLDGEKNNITILAGMLKMRRVLLVFALNKVANRDRIACDNHYRIMKCYDWINKEIGTKINVV